MKTPGRGGEVVHPTEVREEKAAGGHSGRGLDPGPGAAHRLTVPHEALPPLVHRDPSAALGGARFRSALLVKLGTDTA